MKISSPSLTSSSLSSMPLEIAPSLNASLNVMLNAGSRLSPQLKQFLLCDEFFSPQFPQVTNDGPKDLLVEN